MKTVEFDGYEFEVPEWAKFITKDSCGDYFVWSHKPVWDFRMQEYLEDYFYTDKAHFTCVNPIRPVIMFEETLKEI